MKTTILVGALLLAAAPVRAEGELTYRARVTFEASGIGANQSAPRETGKAGGWDATGLFVAAGDSTFDTGSRVRFGGGVIVRGRDGRFDASAREAYARVSAASWLDVEAGKRLVRWGVGYGFAPTGVLDPPRLATDPTDRLGLNEGLVLARADLYRGGTSVTLAVAAPRTWRDSRGDAPAQMAALRLRTVLAGGVEVAFVASSTDGGAPAWGANVTHVVGQQLEWHAEVLLHDRRWPGDADRHRSVSAVVGLQYTFAAGANVVLEYHRRGNGLDDAAWDAVMRGERNPGPSPMRQHAMFVRVARSGADRVVSPELIVIAGLDEGTWTVVPALTWSPASRLQLHGRLTRLAGADRSMAAFAPWRTTATAGVTVRF